MRPAADLRAYGRISPQAEFGHGPPVFSKRYCAGHADIVLNQAFEVQTLGNTGKNNNILENRMLSEFRSVISWALAIVVLAGCAASTARPPERSVWGIKVSAALQSYIDYPASKPQPKLPAEFIVWLAPHGVITDKTMFNSSGNAEWDMAASLALRNAYRLPPDDDGRVPYQAIVSMSPARLFATAVNVPRPGLGREDRPTYGEKIAATVRRHVVFPDAAQLPGNPGAEFDVRLDTDGSIKTVDLTKSSGYSDWDVAARRALLKTETFPLDVSGKAPQRIFITMRPKL